GGSVMLRLADAATAQAALQTLRNARQHADVRGATLRLSPGFVTTTDGVDRLIAALQSLPHR
ncbi:MAG: aminotransferase, partial [Rhodoferax sp.]|nr:aminotransferase [Pseudorhodobacter sp.]